ncbi:hypothetical protein OIU77_019613 [Salix suchowensis]|uniref:Uncharacterized protein n=2 Tax=Salix TaxID=40685 RepID=A0A9Q0P5Q2_9ROSI|nr:hypothetical protein OIU77_019613 [Salix suchowensis]KAJ6681719.1 hypothetical protein OIU74_020060 [Salix koriyanagi]
MDGSPCYKRSKGEALHCEDAPDKQSRLHLPNLFSLKLLSVFSSSGNLYQPYRSKVTMHMASICASGNHSCIATY